MVKLTQNVQAAFEPETSYATSSDSALTHFGLLDTFDPRAVEMAITPVASLGHSTEPFHSAGPINVTLPIKVALQGTGWKSLLGRAIGYANPGGSIYTPAFLGPTANSMAVLAKETGGDFTLVSGVVPNEVTLEADYTAGGYATLDCACTGYFTVDDTDMNVTGGFLTENYSDVSFPSAPTTDPLLPTDITIGYGGATENEFQITGPAGSYVEVGERYMLFYTSASALSSDITTGSTDSVSVAGICDMTHSSVDTIGELDGVIDGKANWAVSATSEDSLSVNLLKGVYQTGTQRYIPNVNSTTAALTSITNLKRFSLKIANNNVSIPGRVQGADSTIKWLQNAKVSRGNADITLDIAMTAEDETFYDKYVAQTTIPLMRIDLGASVGSIALTNGTITSFSRPMSAGGEIEETMTIKFRGNGDMHNFSKYAISADWDMTGL
jgi:hypothetical protein